MTECPDPDAVALVERAEAHVRLSEVDPAMHLASRALALGADDAVVAARAVSVLARADYLAGRYDTAMQSASTAVACWQRLGNRAAEAGVRASVARILLAVGDTAGALEEGLAALEVADSSGDLSARMMTLTSVAIVYLTVGQFTLSLAFCDQAAEIARLMDDLAMRALLADTMGCVYRAMAQGTDGETASALVRKTVSLSQEGMRLSRLAGHRRNEATALANLAEALTFVGEADAAAALMADWPLDPSTDPNYLVSHHLYTRGCIALANGDDEAARGLFEHAVGTAESGAAEIEICEKLAEACERIGDLRAALAHHKRFHALFVEFASAAAQRGASVAAVRLETTEAKRQASLESQRAEALQRSNAELSRNADELQRQALEDPLTGLANRRMMDRLLATDGGGHAVALIDVDMFKNINDRFSHQLGDRVLRQLADLLRAGCRRSDTPVRHGGEEFAVLLRELAEPDAMVAAERVRAQVASFDWSTLAAGLGVTVSIGVVCGKEAPSTAGLLELADQRLYAAKKAGRNRVVGRLG